MSARIETPAARLAPDVVYRIVGDEAVILELESGMYYGLDTVGTRIWSLIDQDLDLDTIVERICSEFEVEPAVARFDVTTLLDELRRCGLVTASGA